MTPGNGTPRELGVSAIARVEGEGALRVSVRDGEVLDVRLDIYEPPRFFEAFLRGRAYTEPPDITARICGICPVAYQMSACTAIEDACGVRVDGQLAALRRLLYCGEWIESHALHIHLLHAPDFLGYDGAVAMAADHRAEVERGLRIKRIGNRIVEVLGGRAIHPINVRIGGFHRLPAAAELRELQGELEWARQAAVDTVAWVAGFPFPAFERDRDMVALHDGRTYPLMGDRIASLSGRLDIATAAYPSQFSETQVEHSTALHSAWSGGEYLVGALARYAVNRATLPPVALRAAEDAGLEPVCRNPFRSIVVRAVEVVAACDEALRIIAAYEAPPSPAIEVPPRAGVGHGASEAPRGLLYHRYELDDDGTVVSATIVPPTAQNQAAIEHDLRQVVAENLDLDDGRLTQRCEQVIRSHDPCISCATHFLDLRLDRS